jgi:hypothetical protein
MTIVQKLNIVNYDFSVADGENAIFVVPDLLTRVTTYATDDALNEMTDEYVIREGETPERVSHRVYGTTEYYDILLQLNKIVSLREDWPMSEIQLEEFAKKKYPGYAADVTQSYELSGVELDVDSTILRLEKHLTSAMNANTFWRMNVGDFVDEQSDGIFPAGTQVVSFSFNGATNEYEVVMSKPSMLAIKAPNEESPEYPKTFSIRFNPMIEAYLAVRYWEDSLGVVREKDDITEPVGWMTQDGSPTEEFTTGGEEAFAVTNFSYEIGLNDAKRNIKIIKPTYIASYVSSIMKELDK